MLLFSRLEGNSVENHVGGVLQDLANLLFAI